LSFEIEPRTRSLIQAAAAGLANVSAERIQEELVKILSTPGVAESLHQLDDLELLHEILPEVTALKEVTQSSPHRWDAYEHTLQAVAALEDLLPLKGDAFHSDVPFPDQVAGHLSLVVTGGQGRRTLLSLAALLHDVGKRKTVAIEPGGRTRFFDHERVGAEMAADVMRRLRFSGDALGLVETIVRYHLRPLHLAWGGGASRRAIHRFFREAGDAGVEIALLSLADQRATAGHDGLDEEYSVLLRVVQALLEAYFHHQGTVVSPPALLTGRDLVRQFGLPEGPAIGRLLSGLKEAQATGEVTDRAQAEDWVRRKIDQGSGTRDQGSGIGNQELVGDSPIR
jgi:putative nucleotidyltransferase with HDIG domain